MSLDLYSFFFDVLREFSWRSAFYPCVLFVFQQPRFSGSLRHSFEKGDERVGRTVRCSDFPWSTFLTGHWPACFLRAVSGMSVIGAVVHGARNGCDERGDVLFMFSH